MGETVEHRFTRSRILKWSVGAATSLGLGLGALVLWGQQRAEEVAAQAEQRLRAVEDRLEIHQSSLEDRPVLWGTGRPGSAFEHYEAALGMVEPLGFANSDLVALRLGREVDPATAQRLRDDWRPVVERMRIGARSTNARRTFDPNNREPDYLSLLVAREVVNMATVQARDALERGDGEESVRISLDAATFGLDLLHSPLLVEQMIGCALLAIATGESWTEDRLRSLDRGSLDLLANGLERLDSMLPKVADIDGELLLFAAQLKQVSQDEGLPDLTSIAETWRFGFSPEWITADAVCRYADFNERGLGFADLRWPERERRLEQLNEQASKRANPLLAYTFPSFLSADRNLADVTARLRLLRMAVDVHRGRCEQVLDAPLADPLSAAPLIIEQDEGTLVMRSVYARAHRKVALPSPR